MNCFWSHNWSKWKVESEGTLVQHSLDGKIIIQNAGKVIHQKRVCLKCNFNEIHIQKAEIE